MPRSSIITSLLVLWHCTTHAQARIFQQIIPSNESRHGRNCIIELGGYGYDLCPLLQSQIVVDDTKVVMNRTPDHRGEGSSNARRFYAIALGANTPLRTQAGDVSSSARSQCDDDTWICLLDVARSPAHERAYDEERDLDLAQTLPHLIVNASEATISLHDSDEVPMLYLRFDHSEGEDIRTRAIGIEISCSNVESFKHREESNMRSFIWTTKHACPKPYPRQNSRLSLLEEPAKDGEPSPEHEEENEGDGDLLPQNDMSRTRRLIAIAVVFLVTSLVCGYVLFSSTKARTFAAEKLKSVSYAVLPLMSSALIKLRPVGNTVKGLASKSVVGIGSRFRQGDSQLVRWAQEDMSLADSEDTMVNGSGAYNPEDGWNGDGLEEYIPLNISPRHGRNRSVRSYGSTPDVQTFAERHQGLLNGFGKYFKK